MARPAGARVGDHLTRTHITQTTTRGSVPLVRPRPSPRLAVLVALVVLSATSSAAADRPTCSDSVSDTHVRARLSALSTRLASEEPAVRRWWTTFLFLHATMATGAAILAGSAEDEGFRNEMLVGMTSSTLGFVSLAVFGPPEMGAGDALRALPERTPAERLHKLRVAEGVFRRGAENIDFLRGWFPATLSSLYVTTAATTLLLGLQRPSGAIIHSIGGAVLGLGRILLRPIGARDTWQRYVRAYPDADCTIASVPIEPSPRVAIVPHGVGIGLRVDF